MTTTFRTMSPIDNSVYVERNYASSLEIEVALNRAGKAQGEWKLVPLSERKRVCSAMVEAFVARKEIIAEEICWQMGRPIRFAGGEVNGLAERSLAMIALADSALAPIQPGEKAGFKRWIQREPLGLVMVVAPWNYPYLTAINAVVPAILAGNSVILKHSAQTPLCSERICEAFNEAGLPEGVMQYLHLNHEDTTKVIADKRVNFVAFTGSVAGGAVVEKAASGRFIGTGLELGGKDPAYVRADANIDHAAETCMDGAFFNSGQSCCGIERIYVHENVYDEFLQKSVAWVNAQILGPSNEAATTLGPLVRAEAADFVRSQIAEAINQGAVAQINANNFPADKPDTAYLAPQILTNVNHTMRVMTEESFGPVVGIQKVSSDDEALALMNDSEYGLTAAIFTQDFEKGIELGQQVETGTFFINRCDYLDPELAWTGIKNSGRGCTLSKIGFEALTRPKSFHIKTTI